LSREQRQSVPVGRLYAFLLVFLLCSVALVARAVNLQIVDTEFLQDQGEARYLREVKVPTRRGNILDRNGEPLAVSTPVDSVWVNPRELLQSPADIEPLAGVLGVEAEEIERRLTQRSEREFVWLRRRLHPDVAAEIELMTWARRGWSWPTTTGWPVNPASNASSVTAWGARSSTWR
jgi:cell division protein FtsI (penicillin-binding protein 3)